MTTSSSMFTTRPIVNTITAGPLLNLMLALDGMEAPDEADRSWAVFKRFAQVPSASVHDVVAFQVAWIQVEDGDPTLSCSFVRQLTDDAAGYGELTRAIQLQYGYSERLTFVPEELDLWSDEFDSLREFFEAVEHQPQFTFLMATPADFTGVYVHEPDDAEA